MTINTHAEVCRVLSNAINFYAGATYNEDDKRLPYFTMMEAECRACLKFVCAELDFEVGSDIHRQMFKNVTEILLVISADLVGKFPFIALEAEKASAAFVKATLAQVPTFDNSRKNH